jgi:hypothetical protein
MNNLFLSNILDVTMLAICIFIVVRVFYVYPTVRSQRILILGLSMGIITFTAIADLISSNIASAAHVEWFLYFGQTIALLFIFLSLPRDSESYLQKVILIQTFASILLICLALLSFVLPDIPNNLTRDILGSIRFLICIGICFYYISGLLQKQSRFGLLMFSCFLLLGIGFLLDVQQYLAPQHAELFDALGDIGRLLGFLSLLGAVVIG